MSGTVFLCSGQGSQTQSMFDLLADHPGAEPVFSASAELLGGRDPRDLVRTATQEQIHRNDLAQILCCTHALAWWSVLRPHVEGKRICAGYSVGEVAAWCVAGVVDVPSCLALVGRRATLMDEQTKAPAGLAAVLGLPRSAIEELARECGVAIAIVNGSDHFVVGGALSGVRTMVDEAKRHGATRTILLPVTVASHTPLLHEATKRLKPILAATIGNAGIPKDCRLLSSIDGTWVRSGCEGIERLAAQVSTTVDWAACMDSCLSTNPSRILELGPGDALARMCDQAASEIPTRSVAAFRSVEGVVAWLAGR